MDKKKAISSSLRDIAQAIYDHTEEVSHKSGKQNNVDECVGEAPPTVELYMVEMIERIDRHLGNGFAKKNPQLLGKLVECCCLDYAATLK